MSLTQLESLEFPWRKRTPLKRAFRTAKNRIQRKTRAMQRKARGKTLAAIRRQYFLTHAYADYKTARALNEDIFVASVMVMGVISYALATMVSNMFLAFLETATQIADLTGFSMAVLLLVVGTILVVLCGWIAAFVFNMMSFSLMDGMNRRQNRSIRLTARRGLRYASRVTGAWISVLTLIFGPLGLAGLLAVLGLHFGIVSLGELAGLFPYVVTAAIAWVVCSLLQFSLLPYVALFEPAITLRQAFARNNQLMKRRGRLFVLAGYGVLTGAIGLAYGLAAVLQRFIRIDNLLTFTVGVLSILVVANGIMVMLYRKRKLARS